MRPRRPARIAAGAALLVAAYALNAAAEVRLGTIDTRVGSGVRVDLVGFYDSLPPSGYAPMRVTIRNESGRAHTWDFRFTSGMRYGASGTLRYDWSAQVDPGRESTFEVMVPLAQSRQRGYAFFEVQVSGYGIAHGRATYPSGRGGSHGGRHHAPFPLLSATLGADHWTRIEQVLDDRSMPRTGCLYDPARNWLPADWRAYQGAGSVWVADADWRRMAPEVRTALMRYVAQGGVLYYCADAEPSRRMDAAGLPGHGDTRLHGLGHIMGFTWPQDGLQVERVVDAMSAPPVREPVRDLEEGYKIWPIKDAVGTTTINAPLLIVAVIVFAIVIGPLNLILFAGPRRRHRLFVTTPALSLLTAVLMGVIILLSDGIGGRGRRVALALLLPEQRERVMIQEQAAISGVLLAQGFPFDADATTLEDIHLTSRSYDEGLSRRLRPERADGAWFRSRSVQAHCLVSVLPSRARIEVVSPPPSKDAGAAPVLLSTAEEDLLDVFYCDLEGVYWYVPELRTGRRTALERATAEAFRERWWSRHVGEGGLRARGRVESLRGRRGYFFAVAAGPPPERFTATHRSIDWDSTLLYMGPCAGTGGAGP